MSSGTAGTDVTLTPADRRILQYLSTSSADYPALIASNTGLHVPLVERRCLVLETAGLLEPVSGEVIYRLTDRGRSVLG